MGVEASFFTGEMPFLSPKEQCQSTDGLMDASFYRRQDACLQPIQQCQRTECKALHSVYNYSVYVMF